MPDYNAYMQTEENKFVQVGEGDALILVGTPELDRLFQRPPPTVESVDAEVDGFMAEIGATLKQAEEDLVLLRDDEKRD